MIIYLKKKIYILCVAEDMHRGSSEAGSQQYPAAYFSYNNFVKIRVESNLHDTYV